MPKDGLDRGSKRVRGHGRARKAWPQGPQAGGCALGRAARATRAARKLKAQVNVKPVEFNADRAEIC
jgi:hypothetical protein